MKDYKHKCPHCGNEIEGISTIVTNLSNEYLIYGGKCPNCNEIIYQTYQFKGYLSQNEVNKLLYQYEVRVIIGDISTEDYAEQFSGNNETKEIMSEYSTCVGAEFVGVFSKFSKKFFTLEDAQAEFSRQSSFHENENGDALNIAETHDVREHDFYLKEEVIYCNDGHNIRISLISL